MKDLVRAWKRSDVETPEFPRIWIREGGFVVRDVTSDLDKYVIQHMMDHYVKDSPTLRSIGLASDVSSKAELTQNWNNQLSQRVSLVVLAEGTPGADLQPVDEAKPPVVLGANIMTVTSNIDNLPAMNEIADTPLLKRHYTAKINFTGTIDVFSMFGVDCVLDTDGLSVDQEIRGKGLGRMLLEARLDMCRGLDIPLTKSMFVSQGAQRLAARVGFQVIKETPFPELLDSNGSRFYNDLVHDLQLSVYRL